MRKPDSFIPFLLVILVAFFTACDAPSEQRNDQALTPLTFKEVNYQKSLGKGCDSTSGVCLKLDLNRVVVIADSTDSVATAIGDSIQKLFLRSPFSGEALANEKALQQEFETRNQQYEEDFPEIKEEWYVDRDLIVVYEGEDYLCFRYDESSFLGGAHPNSFRIYTTYGLSDGRRMSLHDLLNDQEMKNLTLAAESIFRQQLNMAADSSFAAAGFWFPEDQFILGDNFVLESKGIRVFFNAYEIAPYSYGPFELWVPNDQFRKPAA